MKCPKCDRDVKVAQIVVNSEPYGTDRQLTTVEETLVDAKPESFTLSADGSDTGYWPTWNGNRMRWSRHRGAFGAGKVAQISAHRPHVCENLEV